MFGFMKSKVTSVLIMMLISIQCLPGNAWGYDLHAGIKGFASLQVERSDEIIAANKPKIKNSVNQGTEWIGQKYRGVFSFIENKTGLSEKNTAYKIVKNYTLLNAGFNLGLMNGAGVVISEFYSFGASLPTAPERIVNFGYNLNENPKKYQEMVVNGAQAVAGAVLNLLPVLNGAYRYGRNTYFEAAKDPLTLGNLYGEVTVIGGSLILPIGKTKTLAAVGKVEKTTQAGSLTKTGNLIDLTKLTKLFTNVKVRTMTFKNNEVATLFPGARAIDEIPTLQNLLARQIEFRHNSYRKHDPELALILGEVIKNSDLRIRVPDQTTLKKIIADGRFKTQLETHTSQGWYNPEIRRELSNKLFGTDLKTIKASEFEIYGYLGNKNFVAESPSLLNAYGQIIVTFKRDNLFERTTFTLGDSLVIAASNRYGDWSSLVPSRLNNIYTACGQIKPIDLIKYKAKGKKKITPADIISTPQEELRYGIPYIEAQYHGGLFVRDIESITLISNHKPPKLDNALKQMLEENNIKVYYLDEKTWIRRDIRTKKLLWD